MSSIVQTFQKNHHSLPLSQPNNSSSTDTSTNQPTALRRRLSSLSLNYSQSKTTRFSSYSWSFPRSKSVSSFGEYAGGSLRKWWDWGWSWILSRKPVFAQDLEMNEEETKILGCHSKGSWRHVFYKVRSELRRIVRSDRKVGLPQTCNYTSFDYSKNFDNGMR